MHVLQMLCYNRCVTCSPNEPVKPLVSGSPYHAVALWLACCTTLCVCSITATCIPTLLSCALHEICTHASNKVSAFVYLGTELSNRYKWYTGRAALRTLMAVSYSLSASSLERLGHPDTSHLMYAQMPHSSCRCDQPSAATWDTEGLHINQSQHTYVPAQQILH